MVAKMNDLSSIADKQMPKWDLVNMTAYPHWHNYVRRAGRQATHPLFLDSFRPVDDMSEANQKRKATGDTKVDPALQSRQDL